MKRLMIAMMAAVSIPALAAAQTQIDTDKAPQKQLNEAVPTMKNPEGTDGMHPPQKAMDEATESQKPSSASTGASTGESGSSAATATDPKMENTQSSSDKQHAPQEMLNEATPTMKNPEGTDGLHPPQKAMDKATDLEKAPSAATGDSTGESGSSTWNADENKNASEKAAPSSEEKNSQ